MSELELLLKNKKSLYITLGLSLIYIIPLIVADYEYQDDWGRNLYGYGWQKDYRFIATLLGKIWSLNDSILCIYPFSQILSSLILGFTGFLLVSIFNIEKENTIKWSSLLILTSPCFLGNLVFKFDCLPMTISLFVVVFPFIYYDKKSKFMILSLIGVFLSLGLYQSASTVFFIIGSFFLIQNVKNWQWRSFFKGIGVLTGAFTISSLCYFLVLNLFDQGITIHRVETIFFQPDFIEYLKHNFKSFGEAINLLLRSGNYFLFLATFLFFCFLGVINYFFLEKNKLRLAVIILSFLIIILVDFFLISGINIFLKKLLGGLLELITD